jgi:L,D-peptidoglycan transpeptidase YkuD (ErfK/YbiS/YcfS/YnhG family)
MVSATRKYASILPALLFCLLSASCVSPGISEEKPPAAWIQSSLENLPKTSSQVLLVTAEDSAGFRATLYVLEKKDGTWQNAFPPLPALIGSKGLAPPGEKKEGDRKTPSGVFPLQRAFGYAPQIDSRMPYRQAGEKDIWVDDPASADYNRWVRRGETDATSFEVMKRKDDCYKYGIVVEYNTGPVVKGAGSAIFIHVRGGEDKPTLGCVALSERDMLKVLGRLDPAAGPLAVLSTRDSLSLVTKGVGTVAKEDGERS